MSNIYLDTRLSAPPAGSYMEFINTVKQEAIINSRADNNAVPKAFWFIDQSRHYAMLIVSVDDWTDKLVCRNYVLASLPEIDTNYWLSDPTVEITQLYMQVGTISEELLRLPDKSGMGRDYDGDYWEAL